MADSASVVVLAAAALSVGPPTTCTPPTAGSMASFSNGPIPMDASDLEGGADEVCRESLLKYVLGAGGIRGRGL